MLRLRPASSLGLLDVATRGAAPLLATALPSIAAMVPLLHRGLASKACATRNRLNLPSTQGAMASRGAGVIRVAPLSAPPAFAPRPFHSLFFASSSPGPALVPVGAVRRLHSRSGLLNSEGDSSSASSDHDKPHDATAAPATGEVIELPAHASPEGAANVYLPAESDPAHHSNSLASSAGHATEAAAAGALVAVATAKAVVPVAGEKKALSSSGNPPPDPTSHPDHPVASAQHPSATATAATSAATSVPPGTPLPDEHSARAAKARAKEEIEKKEEEEKKRKKAQADAEVDRATFAPIPIADPSHDAELKPPRPAGEKPHDEADASIPKMPSSDSTIRGTLWFDNIYPIRLHWLDMRYLIATANHNILIPKLFAKSFGTHGGYRIIGAIPRANEGGVFVHFEVGRTEKVKTPEDVTREIISLLRAKPVHAWLTPKAVRCHLVKGAPFLDDLASRFPYNRLKIELRGPNTALNDLTVEQLYAEFSQFGKIFDLTLANWDGKAGSPRTGMITFVRMYSAVGARNCLHRLRLVVPLTITSLPATVAPPKLDDPPAMFTVAGSSPAAAAATIPSSSSASGTLQGAKPASLPPPTSEALLFLTYDSLLRTSVITDQLAKHPRIMVPLIGLFFALVTYVLFDPLRAFFIESKITSRFALHELYAQLPWPFGWIKAQASVLGQTDMVKALRRSTGLGEASQGGGSAAGSGEEDTWSARQQDEERVRKWLGSTPDRLLFLTGPRGSGKLQLVKKLTADKKNVVYLDVSHIIERTDEEFVKGLAQTVGFKPGFAMLTWISSLMDLITPGASKASGSSTASSAQILKILECTSTALVHIATKEHKRLRKELMKRMEALTPEEAEDAKSYLQGAGPTAVVAQQVDSHLAATAADKLSSAAAVMDKASLASPATPGQAADGKDKATSAAANAQSGDAATPAAPSAGQPSAFNRLTSGISSAVGFGPGIGGASSTPATPAAAGATPAATGGAAAPAAAGAAGGSGVSPAAAASSATSPATKAGAAGVPGVSPSAPSASLANVSGEGPLRLNEELAPAPDKVPDDKLTVQQRNYKSFMERQGAEKMEKKEKEKKDAAAAAEAAKVEAEKRKKREMEEGEEEDSDEEEAASSSSQSKTSAAASALADANGSGDHLPLFVIDGFNLENSGKHSNFLQVLVSWASEMSAAGVARFVFMADATLEEQVSKSLPDVKLAEVLLSDASPQAAQEFLFASLPQHMRKQVPDTQTIEALSILGGRYNDLQTVKRGIENGAHPIETVEEIVTQSMNAIKSMLFIEDKAVKWTKVQMWQVITALVNSGNGTVLYDDILFSVFSGDDVPLKALVRNDLLRVEPGLSRGGDRLKAGSPVMREAFNRLVHQQLKLRPGMDLLVLKSQISAEQSKINAIEEELMRIAQTTDEVLGMQRQQFSRRMGMGGGRQSFDEGEDGWGGGWRREKGWGSSGSSSSVSGASDTETSHLLQRQAFLVRLLFDSHQKIVGYDAKRRECEAAIKAVKKVE